MIVMGGFIFLLCFLHFYFVIFFLIFTFYLKLDSRPIWGKDDFVWNELTPNFRGSVEVFWWKGQ